MAATQPSELVLDHVGPTQCIAAVTLAVAAYYNTWKIDLYYMAIHIHQAGAASMTTP